MSKSKISEYLLSNPNYLQRKIDFREAAHISVKSVKLTILNKLGTNTIQIKKPFKTHKGLVEINILNQKLKEAQTNKQDLLQKLENVDTSINKLSTLIEDQQNNNKKKKWDKETEAQKTEEIQKNIKKLMQEKIERKKKLQEVKQKELEDKIKEEELKKKEAEEALNKKNTEKEKKAYEAKEKAEERKKYLESIKELKNVKKQKWLYEKLAEEYEKNVILPESQRVSEVISTHHKSHVPSLDELQDHIREYKKFIVNRSLFKESISYSDSKKFPPSKFWQVLNEEEQMAKELDKIREAEKADLLDRKKNYSKLVGQLYQPSIIKETKKETKETKKETKERKKENFTPTKRRNMSMTPTLVKKENSITNSVPRNNTKKPYELPKINYLKERREIREKAAEEMLERYYYSMDIDSLKTAKKVESKAKQAEIVIKGSKATDYNVDAEEKITKMLIDSIKVKLDALNNATTNSN
ncbi:hypothetical protein SteCoe_32422 [Stentor coeruleus]|uniref:Uncharacterized protein n=1 Tax=Stentor coeruleus TaxID=5963 RepID=A0A1R2AZ14_9CILI|nr:hypothetical protein SteCoe_32422 [Stentor coeruleus]